MIILDTDILSLFFANHARVVKRFQAEADEIVTTIISRIEILQGRFATMMKAADASQLRIGQERLDRAERDLAALSLLSINADVAIEFDRLRENRKLKKVRRGDLLIGCFALAYGARLATRNLKDFQMIPGLTSENWAD